MTQYNITLTNVKYCKSKLQVEWSYQSIHTDGHTSPKRCHVIPA